MTELRYWLWLTLKKGITSRKITLLLEHFKTPKDIFSASEETLRKVPGLTGKDVRILSDKTLKKTESVIGICKSKNIKILTFDSPFYPRLLKMIYDPPYVLYARYRERIDLNEHVTVSVVGTRTSTPYGKGVAEAFSKKMAGEGITVVSGMAAGVDSAAARGALAGGGKTVAVLGCGVDKCYPAFNRQLMESIINQGMVLSEYPPGTPPYPTNFPARNRIITGLSLGTLIAEAPKASGALISATLAAEQNREVFAVPADITRVQSKGSNALLQDGVKPVLTPEDIICEFREGFGALMDINKPGCQAEEAEPEWQSGDLTETEQKILKLLSDGAKHIDSLVEEGFDPAELSAELLGLELRGLIKSLPGKQYELSI